MISVARAIERVLESVQPLPPERVDLLEARGRVLAEPIASPRDIPPRDNSAMDGYVFRSADLSGESGRLRVVEAIAAGGEGSRPLAPGEAMKIMTGAPVVEGGDTVVPVEDTREVDGWVEVRAVPPHGANVRPAGEDVRQGETVLEVGQLLRPAEVGMLASLGRSFVSVVQRPRVAILATGDEIVEVDEPDKEGKIVNSNSYGLAAQVAECGGLPLLLGIGRDDLDGLAEMLERAGSADVVLTTGGVSMGDYDYVRPVLEKAGVEIRFWKVAMKPGKPVVFGTRGRVPFFGLPGNPVSALVGFEQFVRPALLRLQGHTRLFRPVFPAVLGEEAGAVKGRSGRTEFVRCRVVRTGGEFRVVAVKRKGSGVLKTLVESNALLILPAEREAAGPGDSVSVQIYDPGSLDGTGPDLPPSV